MPSPWALLASFVQEDGRCIADAWLDWQWDLADWAFDPAAPPNRWESRARGASKTSDCAAILIVLMLLVLEPGSRLFAVACDKDQARLIVDAIVGYVARTAGLARSLDVDAYKVTTSNGTVLEVLSSDAASSWGLKPAFVVYDEVCQQADTMNPRALWQSISSAMGKIARAKLLCCATSGNPEHWSRKIYDHAVEVKALAGRRCAGSGALGQQ